MVIYLALHPMESISLNSIVSLEHLAMLLTSSLEAFGIINFAEHFLNVLDDTTIDI